MDFRWVVLSAGYMGLTLSARGNHIGEGSGLGPHLASTYGIFGVAGIDQ